ncbi:MAG: hypothetical protein ACRDRN_01075 [Sciscionella sp.]
MRDAEIESDLVDAVRQAHLRTSPGDLVQGPQSPQIVELQRLVASPAGLMRRLGLT